MGNSSLVGGGVFMAVVGAILCWAVSDRLPGVDLGMIGIILMVAGVVVIVLGLIPRRSTHTVTRGDHVAQTRHTDTL